MQELVTVWRRSTVGELSWVAPTGPVGIPVVPLDWDDHPCAALPFAHAEVIDTLRSGVATFTVSDGSMLREETPGIAITGRVEITRDLDGDRFVEHLLEQEVVKHPPTRLRADSLMARRENWWWIGRIIVRLTEVLAQRELPKRDRPDDAVLVRGTGDAPRADVVTASDWSGADITLWARDGHTLAGADESAFAFAHAFSPDFERWERWCRGGTLREDTLTASLSEGGPTGPLEPFGVLARLRNHRTVQRACQAGIRAAERHGRA